MKVDPAKHARKIVLVSGPSGAGRSSAIRALEDVGFEVIDNMPLRLLDPLLEGAAPERPLALGIDPRTQDFSISAVDNALAYLNGKMDTEVELLFLDCGRRELLRRFSETRRRHPLAETGQLDAAISREIELLSPLRERADLCIDTSDTNIHELRAQIEAHFAPRKEGVLAVSVQSFSYKRGVPGGVDIVFDCRFLRNPYWEEALRPLDGRDPDVRAHICADTRFSEFEDRVLSLCLFLLPAHREEGKSHLSIAFGCTGGQHRSVAMAEIIASGLAENGWRVSTRHRELIARGAQGKSGV